MKKGFTLIELLVVIAIIAILAAILFPVFAQARQAAKKTQGLSQAKQIGIAAQMYLGDYDDTWFAYRFNGPTGNACAGAACINTDYQKTIAAKGQAFADSVFGARSRDVMFAKQLLDPYVKNDDVWRAPGKTNSWVGYDPTGSDTEAPFRSYGGQNSYALNNFMFEPISGNTMANGAVAESSNTIVMVDGSYYNALPRGVQQLSGRSFNPCSSSYPRYWKNLGNSYLFRWNGSANEPNDAEALKLIDQRYSGVLNVIRADTSAKAMASSQLLSDFVSKGAQKTSMWDPFKAGPTTNTVCY